MHSSVHFYALKSQQAALADCRVRYCCCCSCCYTLNWMKYQHSMQRQWLRHLINKRGKHL